MRDFGSSRGVARRFAGDRKGNLAVVVGVLVPTLAASAGFAVDTAQLVSARSALGAAVDTAVTSTARGLTAGIIGPADAEASVKAALDAGGSGGVLPGAAIVLDRLTVDRTARTVEVAAHVDVPLHFTVFMGRARRVSTVSVAVYSDRRVEVAFTLDAAGSTAGRKIGNGARSALQGRAGAGSVNHVYQSADGAEPDAAFQAVARNTGRPALTG